MTEPASLSVQTAGDGAILVLAGRLDAAGAGPLWSRAMAASAGARGRALVIDLAGVSLCDTAGAAMLLAMEAAHGGQPQLRGARAELASLLDRVRAARVDPPKPSLPAPFTLRGALLRLVGPAGDGVAYLGEAVVAILRLPGRMRMLRLRDLLRYVDQAGVRALPLVLLLGFLIGLILAFQSLIPMRRFGADLFVANLVSISLIRELGPLLAAVVLSGRSASGFAAEIGTMKVNEEIDALVTMGLDPMTMLVLPRMAAAMLVMPGLTLAMNLAGLVGMGVVMMAFGFAPASIARQVQASAGPGDLYGGLFKAVCFGAAVAAIACRAGLATGVGPRAVGLAATAAVVGGIVATIALDGVFAVLFFRLNL